MEEQRLLAVVNKWENVDRSKAADALKQLDKVWPHLEADSPLIALDGLLWLLMAPSSGLASIGSRRGARGCQTERAQAEARPATGLWNPTVGAPGG